MPHKKTPTNKDRPTITLDVARYDKYLTDSDLTEEQKQQFLETLWNIVVSFVDMGFGIDATQAACGQLLQTAFEDTLRDYDMVKSDTLQNKFKNTAVPEKDTETEGVAS